MDKFPTKSITGTVGLDLNEFTEDQVDAVLKYQRRLIDRLQKAFLPTDLPQVRNITFDVVYEPAPNQELFGGDWYEVQRFGDKLAVSIGDVSGHGLDAAIVMAQVKQSLLSAVVVEREPPSAVLSRANQMLNYREEVVVTALFAYLDLAKWTFSYASAGHMPPIYVKRTGEAVYLPIDGIPLAVESQLITSDATVILEPGTSIVLFTDGLVERKDRDVLGALDQLLKVASEECPRNVPRPAHNIYRRMLHREQRLDDVAILTLTVKDKVDVTPQNGPTVERGILSNADFQ